MWFKIQKKEREKNEINERFSNNCIGYLLFVGLSRWVIDEKNNYKINLYDWNKGNVFVDDEQKQKILWIWIFFKFWNLNSKW